MSFWSTQTLKSKLPSIISPYHEKNLGNASYDLALGNEVYISPLPNAEKDDRKVIILDDKNPTAVIPPGQFAFLITEENIKVPKDSIAFISFKFKTKARGLINVSGFHVDPGYEGKLIFATYNAGGSHYSIKKGDPIFTIWFVDLDDEDEKPRSKKGFESIPTNLLNNNADLKTSLPHLDTRLKDLESKVEKYTYKQAILWGLAIAVVFLTMRYLAEPTFGVLGDKIESHRTTQKANTQTEELHLNQSTSKSIESK